MAFAWRPAARAMSRSRFAALLASALIAACTQGGEPRAEPSGSHNASGAPSAPGTPSRAATHASFELVGHEPLFARGMNAGLAVWGRHAYIGSRTDGSANHEHPGVLVVRIDDPTNPAVVGEIGPPHQGNRGETSRELRVWPARRLLIVLNFGCSRALHACAEVPVQPSVRFYDIAGPNAAAPRFLTEYRPAGEPHEMFLWQDPQRKARALLFLSTPGAGDSQFLVLDISGARGGRVREVARWTTSFPDRGPDDNLHSLSVSADGRRAYLAFLTAGFLVLDTSEVASGRADPRIRPVTRLESRPQWPGRGAHSAVKVPGRTLVVTTDEVYGGEGPGEGCPWGWMRVIDVADETAPRVRSEYRLRDLNDPGRCDAVPPARSKRSSFSSHNPTVTRSLALVTWHSAGLHAVSLADAGRPLMLAEFRPAPLRRVATEDPALSSGPDKVVMWSYPVVANGLIYVGDVRNGLFILRYRGPHQDEIARARFLEGNSNIVR